VPLQAPPLLQSLSLIFLSNCRVDIGPCSSFINLHKILYTINDKIYEQHATASILVLEFLFV